ncbi:DDE superfamily endonuclease containing protein [Histomonas meleagridis]|uniref:DDE superfamily endonuclease containing protein n=1 Tax=Histomonas meleagridis TaxID=135588 RepID=UPI00355A4F02|nr:DDE superfamily endonuclease containing protein [Histomonas meleagridis]KAH0804919.1 DDE superfamily endonuclease containing protein [Histomonas meleagridis]
MDDDEILDVKFSPKFVTDFKKRNKLSSRRARYRRRPKVKDMEIDKWINEVKELIESKPANRIINADETSWKILPSSITTWADSGSDAIDIKVSDSEKKMITVMASITFAGTKLPLFMTELVERTQLGDISYHMSAHSESGWMEQDNFESYLIWLRQQYSDDDTLYLIIDQFPVHKTTMSMQLANALNIKMFFIPAGSTDKYQPLDYRVFGCLKNVAKDSIHRFIHENPGKKIGMKYAVQVLIWAWEHLNSDVLNEAWSIYQSI